MKTEIKPCWNSECEKSDVYMECEGTTFHVECANCCCVSPRSNNYEEAIILHNRIMMVEPWMKKGLESMKETKEIKPCWNPDCTYSEVKCESWISQKDIGGLEYWVHCNTCGNNSPTCYTEEAAINIHSRCTVLHPNIVSIIKQALDDIAPYSGKFIQAWLDLNRIMRHFENDRFEKN